MEKLKKSVEDRITNNNNENEMERKKAEERHTPSIACYTHTHKFMCLLRFLFVLALSVAFLCGPVQLKLYNLFSKIKFKFKASKGCASKKK